MEGTEKPDIPAIMADIRKRVQGDIEAHKDRRLPFKAYSAESDVNGARKAGEMVHSEELRYLNVNHAFSLKLGLDSITSHRAGIIGKFIVKAKKKFLGLIWDKLLKDYLLAEKEYNSNLVRFLNDLSKYVDARDASNFWELIRKVDYDVSKAVERVERISDEHSASMHALEKRVREASDSTAIELNCRITRVQGMAERHEQAIKTLEAVSGGLEAIIASLRPAEGGRSYEAASASSASDADFSYVLLENRFRGSESEIAKRLSIYPPVYSGQTKRVLEIGSGRGELQQLFASYGVPSYGVDYDEGMVEEARAKGLNVEQGDGIAHLLSLPDASLGGVIAIQVVEHLTNAQIKALLDLCYRKVAKGGRVVFETINPKSLLALSSNYFRDPSHVFPLHPDTLSFTMTLAGFRVIELRELSPVLPEALLKEISVEDYMTPRWALMIERLNANMRQLNGLLYGHQDYCIIAERV